MAKDTVDRQELQTEDGVALILERHIRNGSEAAQRTVLLLHGASASSRTFLAPESHNLVDHLLTRGCDVWTLDWRGSLRVVPNHAAEVEKFSLDRAAALDYPIAISRIQAEKGEKPLSVFAHCMGAGTLAMAIGAGKVGPEQIDHVVLSTIGLFYQVPWDGWVKAEDQILERLCADEPSCTFIDADPERTPWPEILEKAYERWPRTLLPLKQNEIFRRLAFMFGPPYRPELVPRDIHTKDELRRQFGAMHLRLYIHCAQNVRRGFAAGFDDMSWNAAWQEPRSDLESLGDTGTYLNVENFQGLELTLITGERNELWHPDAIHRMYDWLRRGLGPGRCRKRIFKGYAHQDLLWGEAAARDVYPTISAGLGLAIA